MFLENIYAHTQISETVRQIWLNIYNWEIWVNNQNALQYLFYDFSIGLKLFQYFKL